MKEVIVSLLNQLGYGKNAFIPNPKAFYERVTERGLFEEYHTKFRQINDRTFSIEVFTATENVIIEYWMIGTRVMDISIK